MTILANFVSWALANPDQVVFAGTAVAAGVAWIRKLAVSNHADRLSMVRDAASSAGGQILLEAAHLAPGESLKAFLERRIAEEAVKYTAEFSTTGPKIGLDVGKMAGMIAGEMGNSAALGNVVGAVSVLTTMLQEPAHA